MLKKDLEKMKWKKTGKAEIRKIDFLAIGKAFKAIF